MRRHPMAEHSVQPELGLRASAALVLAVSGGLLDCATLAFDDDPFP